MVAEVPGAEEQGAVPEGVDGGGWGVEAVESARVADVFEAEGHAEEADDRAREAGDDGEGEALVQGVGGGHFVQFTYVSCRTGSLRGRRSLRDGYTFLANFDLWWSSRWSAQSSLATNGSAYRRGIQVTK